MLRTIGLLVLFTFLLSFGLLAVFTTSVNVGRASSSPIQLSVTPIPSKLPSDGGTYPAMVVELTTSGGTPAVLQNNTIVYLSSSQPNVGTVPSSVTIPAGQSYVVVNFTTTTIPGSTTITASSVGITPPSTQPVIQTVPPSGFPTQLKVIPVPSSQLADPLRMGALIVELEDSTGLPAKAVSPTTVTLSSSNALIVGFPTNTVTIPEGSIMALSTYNTSLTTGTTTITASSTGFLTGTAQISVVGVAPLALKVELVPPTAVAHSTSDLVVALTDLSGNPARAPVDIPVTLSSSNTSIAVVPQTVSIPAGNISVMVQYQTLVPGSATITAAAQNLQSGSASLQTYAPSVATGLLVTIAPEPVLADSHNYRSVFVSLVKNGLPAISSTSIKVNLTSSSLQIGSVTSSIIIPAGYNFAIANFTSTFYVGTTTITATAPGLSPSQAPMNTFGPIPAQIRVEDLPLTLPADGGTYTALAVGLVDQNGNPAIAPVNITIQMSSSNPSIATVPTTVTIPAGYTAALTTIQTTTSPGTSTIAVTSQGYAGDTGTVTTVQPGAVSLGLYLAPLDTLHMPFGNDSFVVVQLQDAGGNPARALYPVQVTLTSSNSSVLSQALSFTILPGSTEAVSYITFGGPALGTKSVSTATLTASASGYKSSQAQVTVNSYPMTLSMQPSSTSSQTGTPITVTISLDVMGSGVQGATVVWSTTAGLLTPTQSVIGPSGVATTQLTSNSPGTAVVTASITSSQLGHLTQSVTVTFTQPVKKPSLLQTLFSFPYVLIIVAIIVIAALLVLIIIRRRQAPEL